jgi:peptidoglycan glycosyltransferase
VNHAIRRVGIATVVLVLVLVAQLTYLQVFHADSLAGDPRNVRTAIRDFTRPRGEILTADGEVVARSVETDDELKFQREYPFGATFAQIAGYQSFVYGNTGVEKTYNDDLVGRNAELQLRNIGDVLIGKETTGNVVLGVRAALQTLARDLLADRKGSIVALNPKTGLIEAMYSNPSYDPQPFAGHDTPAVTDYGGLLQADPNKPDLPRAYREIFPPGSTFKVVTATVGLETGVTTAETTYPNVSSIPLPLSNSTLSNFGNQSCGGTLFQSFTRSCNTTFAKIGLDLGEQFPPGMAKFGIYATPPLDVSPGAVASTGPRAGKFTTDQPRFALAGIGQGDVAVTPLQMALVAAAIANGGVIMQPHVAEEITDQDDSVIRRISPKAWMTATDPQTAATVKEMMISVVENGTGTAAQIDGITVAGKTGTAQNETGAPHAWFISFAPAEDPQVAVAVIIEGGERGSPGSEATGGVIAAPLAQQIMSRALGR